MTRTIFQVGLLAFCVAAVWFGLEESDVLAVIARSFIVFTAVTGAGMVLMMIIGWFVARQVQEEQAAHASQEESKAAASAAK